MNYFAKLNNNIVVEVICVSESFDDGAKWCQETYGGQWVQTFDSSPNKNYAAIGYIYNPELDDFVVPPSSPCES